MLERRIKERGAGRAGSMDVGKLWQHMRPQLCQGRRSGVGGDDSVQAVLQRLDVPTSCLQLEFARFQALEDLGRGLVHGAARCIGGCPFYGCSQLPLPAYRLLRRGAGTMAAMTKTNAGKARWARTKAAGLWQQATELDRDRTGSWKNRAGRRRAADRLRTEAARFESIARRLDPSLDDQAA